MGIRPLEELSKSDAAIAGGKGANLGEMLKLGLPVPPGFCLTVDTYVEHMRAIGLEEKGDFRVTRADDPPRLIVDFRNH